MWNEGTVFGLANLEALEVEVLRYDFDRFVFTPDDPLHTRGEVKAVARDNVLFELSLFLGKLTRRRSFIIRPVGSAITLPSDLAGITTASYEFSRERSPEDTSYLEAACAQIRRAVRRASVSEQAQ
jgi:predicted nucleotide-binding protein